jgi:transposase
LLPYLKIIFMGFCGPQALTDKQGNSLLRFLLVEAAQAATRSDPQWRGRFLHLAMRRERRIAKVAMARKLAVRLFWMWRFVTVKVTVT